jgi:hypothetical protein
LVTEESLALYEITAEGFENIGGLPTANYVQRRADPCAGRTVCGSRRRRLGEPTSEQLAAATARMMFNDRKRYTD